MADRENVTADERVRRSVARTLGNLGIVHRQVGELVEARRVLERALAIEEQVYGPDHPEVARMPSPASRGPG